MSIEEDGEISFLDLMVVLAENAKLLILGPVFAGLVALGLSYGLPPSYISHAILVLPNTANPPSQVAALMVSPVVLDPVLVSLGKVGQGLQIENARMKLVGQIQANVGKDSLLRLEVTAQSPEEAQQISIAIIDSWLKSTVPNEQEREDLQKKLVYAKTALESVRQLIGRLPTDGARGLNRPVTWGDGGASIVSVHELQARYLNDVLNIPRVLKGLSQDVVKQPPTLPAEPVSSHKRLVAIMAALAAAIALVLWVFIRQAWRNASRDPQTAEKQARLLAALGLKR